MILQDLQRFCSTNTKDRQPCRTHHKERSHYQPLLCKVTTSPLLLFRVSFYGLWLFLNNSTIMSLWTASRMACRRSTSSVLRATTTTRRALSTTLKDSYEHILVEKRDKEKVGLITLNRPKALNALCDALFDDLLHASQALNRDESIGCLVLTGSTKGENLCVKTTKRRRRSCVKS